MLVVNMAAESVGQLLNSINSEFVQQARDYVSSRAGLESETQFPEAAQQCVVLTSSLVLAGYTGFAACMDFYNASPFSVQSMVATKKLALESVVRVNLSTGLLIAIVDGLRREASQWIWTNGVRSSSGAPDRS
jgi:hypothetical protein